MSEKETILEIQNLGVSFKNNPVLKEVNFKLKKGEMLGVIGPNGAGKTVLVKSILGLIDYSGKVIWKKGIKVGYVPQNFNIENDLPLTVGEFFSFKTNKFKEIYKVLEQVGWHQGNDAVHKEHHLKHHLLTQRLGELSGGQLQRILVAWALLDNPDVLIFDEPTSGVDAGAEITIYSTLAHLKEDLGMTIIFVSHELNIVYKYATEVLCLNKDKICFGSPKSALNSKSLEELYGEEINFHFH